MWSDTALYNSIYFSIQITILNTVNLIIYTGSALSVRNKIVHDLLTVNADNFENYEILKFVLLTKSSWPHLH
jgi:hypothetical protein